jgi:hypothetical protein
MDYELHKTSNIYYEIQYTTVWDEGGVWYPTKHAGENKFKMFAEASRIAKELSEQELKSRGEQVISEYRIVQHVVTTSTESIKHFPVGNV